MLLQIVQEILTNYTKVIAGMVAATMCLAVLGVIFLPSFGYKVEPAAQVFVFSIAQGIVFAVGLGGNNAIARTLGVLGK